MQVVRLKTGRKAHAVRNRQSEYVGHEGKNVVTLETFCGRHVLEEEAQVAVELTCGSCTKGTRKAG